MIGTVHRYGVAPFQAAAIHGGPGAPGSAIGLAREMARYCGTLEPWQTGFSIQEQIEELAEQLQKNGNLPMVLVGHSWGAWLAALTAESHADLVSGLILVGCPPLEERFVPCIASRRRAKLSPAERLKFERLITLLENGEKQAGGGPLRELEILMKKADACALLPEPDSVMQVDMEQHAAIWNEAADLRRSGELLCRFQALRTPVVLIQGEEDPHPVEGVTEPLRTSNVLLRSHILPQCGHTPWRERFAAEPFRHLLRQELAQLSGKQLEC